MRRLFVNEVLYFFILTYKSTKVNTENQEIFAQQCAKSHIVAHEVFIGLPLDDDTGFSAANHNDRRTRVAVVI